MSIDVCPSCSKKTKLYAGLCSSCHKTLIDSEKNKFQNIGNKKKIENSPPAANTEKESGTISVFLKPIFNDTSYKIFFFILFIIFFILFLFIFDMYLWTFFSFMASMFCAMIVSGLLTLVLMANNIVALFFVCAITIASATSGFMYIDYVKEKQKKEQQEEMKKEEALRKEWENAPYRCNEEQRNAAKNDMELMKNNGVATRETDGRFIVYNWHKNWWFMSEIEQQSAITKVSDIEACFSKKGYGLPTVYINYRGTDVAKADPTNGTVILQSKQ